MLYPCIFCVALLMSVFVLRVYELFVETIRNTLGVVAILLLNIIEVLKVGGGAMLVFQRMCVLCL